MTHRSNEAIDCARRTMAARFVVMGLAIAVAALMIACGIYLYYAAGKRTQVDPNKASRLQIWSPVSAA